MRRSFRNVALVLVLLGSGSIVHLAQGADAKVEAEAKKADGEAMDLWLAADFKGAKGKLEGVLKKCGKDKCGAETQAMLHRDLGVVLITMGDKAGGKKEFDAAVAADPNVGLAKDYLDNADVKSAWEASKKSVAPPATTTAPTATTPPISPDAEGNLSIEASVAPIGYVLPVVVKIPEGLDAQVVKVSYKTSAMDKFKTLEAKKEGDVFVTRIPCEDTQFQGDIKVYVRAYDADKNEVDHYGSLKKPAILKLVDKMPENEEAPSFPGGKEPEKCVEKGDCQPGFPCDKNANKKPQGSGCEVDDECDAGLSCVENQNGKKWCYESGGPSKAPTTDKKIWFGVDGQIDLLYIGAEDDICRKNEWACSKDGKDVGLNSVEKGVPLREGGGGKTSGGPALATIRAFVSVDYFFTPNIAAGVRLGYAFNGNPTENAKFLPFHGEARLTYFLGQGPLRDPKGFKPYLLASGGIGEFDALVPDIAGTVGDKSPNDRTVASDFADDPAACAAGPTDPASCRISKIKAYRLAGQAFAAVGAGFWYMLSPKIAINVGLKFLVPLPTFSPGIAPEIGIHF
jgi:hypothetical protein